MSARLLLVTFTYSCGALIVGALFDWSSAYLITLEDAFGLLAFIALAVAADLLGVNFSLTGRRDARSSVAFIPLFACALHYPPPLALTVAFVVSLASGYARRLSPAKLTLNASIAVIALGAATVPLHALNGTSPSTEAHIRLIAFVAFVATAFAANSALISLALAWINGRPLARIFEQAIGGGGANIMFDLLASPFAYITALLYRDYGIPGLVIVVLPLIVVRSSYFSKVRLEQANQDLLAVLVKAIETRDPYTSGHSLRVAEIARLISSELGLPKTTSDKIYQSALLHDIGKIDSAFAAVIQKPTPLTESERRIIQAHATAGADLLESLSSLDPEIIKAVRHHHESYDGSGYPDGLAGTNIPLAARIIMLSDSIDAMLSNRPYRAAMSVECVENELRRCSGSQFDPVIVDVVIESNTLRRALGIVAEPHDPHRHQSALIG